MNFPKLPGIKAIHRVASTTASTLGLSEVHGADGVILDPDTTFSSAIEHADWRDSSGFAHVQIIGDSARAKKTFGVTNVCFRGFHTNHFFNSLSTMRHL